MMTKHTPGKWKAIGWTIVTSGSPLHNNVNWTVGSVFDHGDDNEAFANARLMAAAPDLLAMLEEMLPDLECQCHLAFTSRGKHDPKTLCHYADAVKSAIAKAKGAP